jgi:integrase
LPDLEQTKSAVLNSLTSKSGQRTYDHAINEFVDWYCSEPRLAFNRTVVLRYRIHLEQRHLAPTTINLRLAAVRRVAYEAADSGLLSPELTAGIRRVKGVRRIGVRLGNWLTADQGRSLLLNSQGDSLRSKRNCATLALLIGCGLRRGELLTLSSSSIQLREEHWVIADLHGKAGHIRTVPIPLWVKAALDRWTEASGIKDGWLFRAINKSGKIWGEGMTPKVLWEIVKRAAEAAGIEKLAPHDLRRTCARLCHLAGGELDQIQFLLGHVSIQTTEHYLGCKQKLRFAVNDKIGIEPSLQGTDYPSRHDYSRRNQLSASRSITGSTTIRLRAGTDAQFAICPTNEFMLLDFLFATCLTDVVDRLGLILYYYVISGPYATRIPGRVPHSSLAWRRRAPRLRVETRNRETHEWKA